MGNIKQARREREVDLDGHENMNFSRGSFNKLSAATSCQEIAAAAASALV